MQENIIAIICEITKKDRQTLLDNFDHSDIWDSLMRVEVMFALEEEFEIQFTQDELKELTTPQKMCSAVLAHREEA